MNLPVIPVCGTTAGCVCRGSPGGGARLICAALALLAVSGCAPFRRPASPPGATATGGSVYRALARLQDDLPGATIAVFACDAETGARLASLNADSLVVPASTMKLFTTAAALDALGPDHRFATSLRVIERGEPASNDLLLIGTGDPTLGTPTGICMDALASEFARALRSEAGSRSPAFGDLIVDASWLDAVELGPDWQIADVDSAYGAPISALTMNENAIPVELRWNGAGFDVVSDHAVEPAIGIGPVLDITHHPAEAGEPVKVSGTAREGDTLYLSVPVARPTQFWGTHLREALRSAGVVFTGAVREAAQADRIAPSRSVALVHSPPLRDIIVEMNKHSLNLHAELIFRTLGRIVMGEGSFDGGRDAVRQILAGAGIDTDCMWIADGSGLSRTNLVTTRAVAELLLHMRNSPYESEFRESLAVAGVDGTISRRFKDTMLEARLHAKTGTLRHVTALSGYMELPTREVVFSIIVNGRLASARDAASALDSALVEMAEEWGRTTAIR